MARKLAALITTSARCSTGQKAAGAPPWPQGGTGWVIRCLAHKPRDETGSFSIRSVTRVADAEALAEIQAGRNKHQQPDRAAAAACRGSRAGAQGRPPAADRLQSRRGAAVPRLTPSHHAQRVAAIDAYAMADPDPPAGSRTMAEIDNRDAQRSGSTRRRNRYAMSLRPSRLSAAQLTGPTRCYLKRF